MARNRVLHASREIATSPEVIFNLLANPRDHWRIDGSGTVNQPTKAPARLSLGATFSMQMHNKLPYVTTNKVVSFEENRTIAWCHAAKFVWRYDLEPIDGGTRVTESFDYNRPWGFVLDLLGWPAKNQVAMEATLARLDEVVTH